MSTDLRLKESLSELADRIVATYAEPGTVHHLGHCPLPQYDAVVECLSDLKEILFPGFGRREKLHAGNVLYHVGDLIDGLHDKLTTQIARALMHADRVDLRNGVLTREGASDPCDTDYEAKGQQITVELLRRLPDLRRLLGADVHAAYRGDPACKGPDEVVLCYPGLQAIAVHRIAHELYGMGVPYIPRMMAEWSHKRTGIDIHPGATVGRRFFIDHGTGVVIGETCRIGDDVKIYQGVTLGALSFPKDADGNLIRDRKRHPTIEDGVVIYANATILGGKTVIGRESVIGSSVWVTESVAPKTTVIMEKPRLRMKSELPDDMNAVLNFEI